MTPAETAMRAWLPMTEADILAEWTERRRFGGSEFKPDPLELLKSLERRKLARLENGIWHPWSVEEFERTKAPQKSLFR